MITGELRGLYTQSPSDAEFGKLIQTLTEIQLSNDWKAGQEHTFPNDLNLTLTTALTTYDTHYEKAANTAPQTFHHSR